MLVIEPIPVVRAKTGIEDPLLKAEIAPGQIASDQFSVEVLRMPGEVGDARNDAAASMQDDLASLALKDLTCQPQIALVFLGESDAEFELLKLLQGNGRWRNFGTPKRITRNGFGDFVHRQFP